MIIENQKITVNISRRNISFYKNLGYDGLKIGDELLVGVDKLSKGSHLKVSVKCDYCGNIVNVVYKDYVNYKFDKYSCVHCRQKKTSEYNLKQRQNDLYKRALNICLKNGYTLITKESDISNSDTRVLYKCPKHGIKETKIYTLISGHGCIDCASENIHLQARKSADDVYNDFKQYGGILLNKNDYLGWNYKNLNVICNECGEIFTTSYCAFMQHGGQVCSKCASNLSKGERAIKNILEEHNIEFNMQFRFDDCRNIISLPFDFYLPNYNVCIEYDGEGHYKPINRGGISDEEAIAVLNGIKYRDSIKTDYCNDNNIKLIRIPYWDFDNINYILTTKLFT